MTFEGLVNANSLHIPLCDESVQMCVTSPPYFGLRDYQVDEQLGLEETPEAYIANMVSVFREVWRVMKPSATLWLNIGDSYAGSGKGRNGDGSPGVSGTLNKGNMGTQVGKLYKAPSDATLKSKDLMGIPWMLAFALRADGWYLRSDIIWHKPNPMPESVTDRPTKSHEYIFLLSKQQNYYYDADAIMEVATGYDGRKDTKMKGSDKYFAPVVPGQPAHTFAQHGHERWKYKNLQEDGQQPNTLHLKRLMGEEYMSPVRNKRSVWSIPTQSYEGAHFATFPPKLIEPCIKAGSKERDVVLDPFCGSGTTIAVARYLRRSSVGIDLSMDYLVNQAKKRLLQMVLI